ncbi:MAG: ATP-binding cassette domain-containing protein [Xanthobacteraceae bacterium]|jgi:ATP-binding cassette subfamily C protein
MVLSNEPNAAARCESHGCEPPFPVTGTPPDAGGALRLARAIGVDGLRSTLSWQFARMLLRLGFAAALAIFAGRLITAGTFSGRAFLAAITGLVLSGGAGFFADVAAARAEAQVGNGLRAALQRALAKMSSARIRTRAAGRLIAGLQRHPERLASLTIGHAAAKSMLAAGPLLAAAAICIVSWQAALALLLAIPVMILFFALLGGAVRSKAAAQEHAFGRLAAQFSDRIRTLPTILANHALARERGKIERRMAAYAHSTMGVLGVAFLNAGVIDFFSALAIAVLAVFLGLGHLGLVRLPGFAGLELWQSLFILVIAADFFTPFRRFAEQYHIKAEGEAAAKELDWYFGDAVVASIETETENAKPFISDDIDRFDASDLPTTGLIAISGPSGAGKSTLLRMLAGIEDPSSDVALPQVTTSGCVWMSTEIYLPAGKLSDAIAWNCAGVSRAALRQAAESVGLIDETLLPGGLDARIAEGGANLSGGQRMRIGIARILISDRVVFADEPTAKLDPTTATLVRRVLTEVAIRRLVIVATHDDRLIEIADRHHALTLPKQRRTAIAA